MRLSTLALFAVLANSASAFAPAQIFSSHRNSQSTLQFSKNDNNNNQFSNQIEDAKNAFLGTVTAATLFVGALAPLPGDSAVANAAAAAAPSAATTATKATTAVKKEPVAAPAPLAAEKAAVASAKAAVEATKKVGCSSCDQFHVHTIFFLVDLNLTHGYYHSSSLSFERTKCTICIIANR